MSMATTIKLMRRQLQDLGGRLTEAEYRKAAAERDLRQLERDIWKRQAEIRLGEGRP